MATCKWTKHIDEGVYTTECGKHQGEKIRPKQKICYCGKRIERINLNTISEPMQQLQSALSDLNLYK